MSTLNYSKSWYRERATKDLFNIIHFQKYSYVFNNYQLACVIDFILLVYLQWPTWQLQPFFGKSRASFAHLWTVYLSLLVRSSHAPWEMSVNCYFRSLHRCSVRFKCGLWLGHLRPVRDLKPVQHCLGCMLQAVVMLEGESLRLSPVMWCTFFQSMSSAWRFKDLKELKYFCFYSCPHCCLNAVWENVFPQTHSVVLVAGWLKWPFQHRTSEAVRVTAGPFWMANSRKGSHNYIQVFKAIILLFKNLETIFCSWPDLHLTTVLFWKSRRRFLDLLTFCADTWILSCVSFSINV